MVKYYIIGSRVWWEIYSYRGHKITGPHLLGSEYKAMEWGNAFISSWQGSTLIYIESLDEIYKQSKKETDRT